MFRGDLDYRDLSAVDNMFRYEKKNSDAIDVAMILPEGESQQYLKEKLSGFTGYEFAEYIRKLPLSEKHVVIKLIDDFKPNSMSSGYELATLIEELPEGCKHKYLNCYLPGLEMDFDELWEVLKALLVTKDELVQLSVKDAFDLIVRDYDNHKELHSSEDIYEVLEIISNEPCYKNTFFKPQSMNSSVDGTNNSLQATC